MITIHSERHRLRDVRTELFGGELVPPFEKPSRAEHVLARVRAVALGPVREPGALDMAAVLRVHDAGFVEFLQTAWQRWQAQGYRGEAIPLCWPARRMAQRIPAHIDGLLGYYAMAGETSISAGTWEAAAASAATALTAAGLVRDGERAAFALCRPPGHHAARDLYGGYCFLNNAAIAAQRLRDGGAERVAVLDIDFHHGNGTQDIFYERGDVLFVSLHGDPVEAFPHFLGYADETGAGAGAGCNLNLPLSPGADFAVWGEALEHGLAVTGRFAPQALVVSLGVDTFENDPISFFRLKSEDYLTVGAAIARLGLPTLFVLEGGYDVGEIGLNAVNVLQGFENV